MCFFYKQEREKKTKLEHKQDQWLCSENSGSENELSSETLVEMRDFD